MGQFEESQGPTHLKVDFQQIDQFPCEACKIQCNTLIGSQNKACVFTPIFKSWQSNGEAHVPNS